MEAIDAAYIKLEQIIQEITSYDHTIFTEQDTRVKIIDRILVEVLGYSMNDIQTESRSGVGYLDYQITLKGIGKLVIEAKKDGAKFNIDTSYSGRAYNIDGAVLNGQEVKNGISQAIYYAAQESIELGCLTNGKTWIIFRANRMGDGKKVIQGKAFVFGSLENIKKDFKLFYELLSPLAIQENNFRALFQEAEGNEIRNKEFVQVLKDENTIKPFSNANYSGDFDRVMTAFFSKLSGDDDPELLIKCFVETKESQAAEYQLARISNDLINKVRNIETIEGDAIREVIERIKHTNRQEFIILVGGKGAGKSTFVERFFTYILSSNLKEDCIVVRVNMGGYKGSDSEITKWLDNTLLDVCEKGLYNGAPSYEEIQGMFYGEYKRLRNGNWKKLYEKDKTQFKIDFGKHIESRRENRPTEYIQKLIGNIVKSRRKIPCIVFDNADHFSIEIQEKVFQYARAIYENEVCLIIIPITDKTSWQLSKQGAIRSYESEVLFLPTPPPRKVIEKRIAYIEDLVETEKAQKGQYFLKKGIRLELQNIEGFVRYLQVVFLQDSLTSKWIGALANYDIRTCLEITKDLIASPHISIDEFLKAYIAGNGIYDNDSYVIKPYRIKRAIIKRNYHSYPVNHHPYIQNLFYAIGDVNTSPLLALRILQVLYDRKTDASAEDHFIQVSQLLDYFNAMSIDRNITRKHLQFLLSKGLVNSYDPSIIDIDFSKSLEITPSGNEHYYWCINDYDYSFIMLEVTPITDKLFFKSIQDTYYYSQNKSQLIIDFLNYLEEEDLLYCKVPPHIAYNGQRYINERFERVRNVLKKKLK